MNKPTQHHINTADTRRQLKLARKHLSQQQQSIAALKLALRIARHPCYKHANVIAGYNAINGEISLTPLMKLALAQGKQWLVPHIKKNTLQFKTFDRQTKIRSNQFGISEAPHAPAQAINKIDLFLCPLVAFDAYGNRVGMGGGFYDRTLKTQLKKRSPYLFGVAHDLQQVARILPNSWDIALEGIFTPTRFLKSKRLQQT
ncbi:MAG: 5-formyltetrahydrofolate cyclo-ligase [Marinagarivorans sp.]|nr:5-formyltetrahydrofolate cyclo-ligase [Marinagarivorans sp.]